MVFLILICLVLGIISQTIALKYVSQAIRCPRQSSSYISSLSSSSIFNIHVQNTAKSCLYGNKFDDDNSDRRGGRGKSSRDSGNANVNRPSINRSPRPRNAQDNIKLARFARTLRDELSDIISSMDIKAINYPDDDLLRGTGIVDVEVSSDMMNAKMVISVLGNSVEKRKVYLWLCDNIGQVRYSLAKRMRYVRRIPTLSVKLMDPQTAEIMNIIEEEAMKRQLNANKVVEEVEFDED